MNGSGSVSQKIGFAGFRPLPAGSNPLPKWLLNMKLRLRPQLRRNRNIKNGNMKLQKRQQLLRNRNLQNIKRRTGDERESPTRSRTSTRHWMNGSFLRGNMKLRWNMRPQLRWPTQTKQCERMGLVQAHF